MAKAYTLSQKINISSVKKSHKEFAGIYKFLSPEHLLKKFSRIDNNKPNQGFYDELLYIMGVKEQRKKNSSLREIVRLSESKRQNFSFLEQVFRKLELQQVKEDEQFDIALNLVLTWVNRLLFLKLLESQLMAFNKSHFNRFLTFDKVRTFRDLSDLFHKALAVPEEERERSIKKWFSDVPYLNSSLFEVTDFEKQYVLVDDLNEGDVEVFNSTKLKDAKDKRLTGTLPLLKYIFQFLDAYKFYVGEEDDDEKEQKTIISASVLGLIFEKINGYKDGAYFTPNHITQYMCKTVLRQIVVDKFNDAFGYQCDSQVFSDATTYTCIINVRREQNEGTLNVSNIPRIKKETLAADVVANREVFDKNDLDKGIWVTSSVANLKKMIGLKETIDSLNWDDKSRSLLVSYLQGEGLKVFSEAEATTWLLCLQKGSTLSTMGIDPTKSQKPSEEEAWEWFNHEYPSSAEWLLPFKKAAKARQDKGDYWWELRACSYYKKFEQPKIFYQAFQTKPCFIYDGNVTYCNNSTWLLSLMEEINSMVSMVYQIATKE